MRCESVATAPLPSRGKDRKDTAFDGYYEHLLRLVLKKWRTKEIKLKREACSSLVWVQVCEDGEEHRLNLTKVTKSSPRWRREKAFLIFQIWASSSPLSSRLRPGNQSQCTMLKDDSAPEMHLEDRERFLEEDAHVQPMWKCFYLQHIKGVQHAAVIYLTCSSFLLSGVSVWCLKTKTKKKSKVWYLVTT